MCKICSEVIIKSPERRQWHGSCDFNVNFEHVSLLLPLFLFLTLNKCLFAGLVVSASSFPVFALNTDTGRELIKIIQITPLLSY